VKRRRPQRPSADSCPSGVCRADPGNPKQHSLLRKTQRLLTEFGGIAAQIADHIWTGNKLKPFERSLPAQFWANRLWTLDRQRMCLGTTAVPDATCPYCHKKRNQLIMSLMNATFGRSSA